VQSNGPLVNHLTESLSVLTFQERLIPCICVCKAAESVVYTPHDVDCPFLHGKSC